MSEEEKEAIEQLKSWREYIVNHRDSVNKANDIEFYLRTILNLIENQQKELEKKDKIIDAMAEEIHSIVNLGEFIDKKIDNLDTKTEIKHYFEDFTKKVDEQNG